jgi:hypothetical protein
VCDDERLLAFQNSRLRQEIAQFDAQLDAWLASPEGRFAVWLAERQRRH